MGQFEGCPPVRGRTWLRGAPGRGLRVGRGRASSLPAEFSREAAASLEAVASLEAASLESIVSRLQGGKKRFHFHFHFLPVQ